MNDQFKLHIYWKNKIKHNLLDACCQVSVWWLIFAAISVVWIDIKMPTKKKNYFVACNTKGYVNNVGALSVSINSEQNGLEILGHFIHFGFWFFFFLEEWFIHQLHFILLLRSIYWIVHGGCGFFIAKSSMIICIRSTIFNFRHKTKKKKDK